MTFAPHPPLRAALGVLEGKISDEAMRRLNYAVDGEHRDIGAAAEELLDKLQARPQ